MADEKKPDAKAALPPSSPTHPDPVVEIGWLVIWAVAILYFIRAVVNLLSSLFTGKSSLPGIFNGLTGFIHRILLLTPFLKIFLVIISILMFTYIWYLYVEIKKLRLVEKKLMYPEVEIKKELSNPQWERILTHIETTNENDWRLAIIEADIMLADLLDKLLIRGETIGDKLKLVEKSDFTTVDNAWEAHKVRNQIAHDGPTFVLNQREAKRVVNLYKTVFDEFRII